VTIRGKGNRERLVPILPVVRDAVEAYRALCPFEPAPGAPLFLGARGGPLNPRAVQQAVAQARAQLGLPATATPHALRHSFATHLLEAAATCARSRNCSATPRSPRRRSTPASTRCG
jgi:integrase/recombinase XerC